MTTRRLMMVALALLLVVSSSSATELEELTADSAEAFFDAAWKKTISPDGKIPGAVVTVVKDGNILLAKGYGVRDIDTGKFPTTGHGSWGITHSSGYSKSKIQWEKMGK